MHSECIITQKYGLLGSMGLCEWSFASGHPCPFHLIAGACATVPWYNMKALIYVISYAGLQLLMLEKRFYRCE